jgi:hypothetical protein
MCSCPALIAPSRRLADGRATTAERVMDLLLMSLVIIPAATAARIAPPDESGAGTVRFGGPVDDELSHWAQCLTGRLPPDLVEWTAADGGGAETVQEKDSYGYVTVNWTLPLASYHAADVSVLFAFLATMTVIVQLLRCWCRGFVGVT